MTIVRDLDAPVTQRDLDAFASSLGSEKREIEHLAEELPRLMREAARHGLLEAIEELAKADNAHGDKLLKRAFVHFSESATSGLSQWIGKRVLMILAAAAFSSSIVWAVMTGRIK